MYKLQTIYYILAPDGHRTCQPLTLADANYLLQALNGSEQEANDNAVEGAHHAER